MSAVESETLIKQTQQWQGGIVAFRRNKVVYEGLLIEVIEERLAVLALEDEVNVTAVTGRVGIGGGEEIKLSW